MKRVLLAVLLVGGGLSALGLGGCSGPTPPPGDAGFFGGTWPAGGTDGTGSGATGGSSGTGGSAGNPIGSGDDGGARGGRGGRQGSADAGPLMACPAGAADDATCTMPGLRCAVPAADGGRGGAICACRDRDRGIVWRCDTP
jgi:hypothetical protein